MIKVIAINKIKVIFVQGLYRVTKQSQLNEYIYICSTMAGTKLKMLRNQNLGDEDDEFEGDGNNNLQ